MRDRGCLQLLALILGAVCLGPGVTSAQVVRGTLIDSEGEPVAGAMISLMNPDGGVVAGTLSAPDGGFELTGVSGEHRLRADRIGHTSTFAGPFELSPGDTVELRLVAEVEVVRLVGLDIEGDRRCRVRPEEGLAVARVWEEARKALAAAAWTQDRGVYRFEMMRITRSLDRDGRSVLDESRTFDQGYVRSPFVSLPAEQLRDEGYVIRDAQGSTYYAPDASVLLSDPFLDTHCFRLEEGHDDSQGLIGLAFEPLGGRDVPEIEGTIWIDPETVVLRWLDYRYRNLRLPDALMSGVTGGRVDFSAMPNGTWIVRSWRIRMPRPGARVDPLSGVREPYLAGFSVIGGEVLRAHDRAGPVLGSQGQGSRIVGAVFDSLRTGGLQGAEVYALGTDLAAVTGFDGRFVLDGLEPGTYQVTFRHPYMDALSYAPQPYAVEVGADTTAQVNFLAPPARRIMDELCADVAAPARSAVRAGQVHPTEAILTGRVMDTEGSPVAGATVRVLWREWEFSDRDRDNNPQVDQGRLGTTTTSDASGRYIACWVPAGLPLEVAAIERMEDLDPGRVSVNRTGAPLRTAGGDRFVIPEAALHGTRDLVLDRARTGGVRGRVVGTGDGAALPGVTVLLVQLGRTVVTDMGGRFEFDVVPAGDVSVQAGTADGAVTSPSLVVRPGEVVELELRLPNPERDGGQGGRARG